MTVKDYKYLHVAIQGGVSFLTNLTYLLSTKNGFNPNEHFFVTHSQELFDRHNPECTVVISPESEIDIINKFGNPADVIFIHGFHSSPCEVSKIKRNLRRKIIWRTWGHDIRIPEPHPTSQLKTIYRRLCFLVFKHTVKKFYTIGIANLVDDIKVKRAFGTDTKTSIMPYTSGIDNRSAILQRIDSEMIGDNFVNIMVGHSGYELDNHIEILQKLLRFKNKNIRLFLPLSYGNSEYIQRVKQIALSYFGNKAIIIEQRMEYEEYARFIKSIDIAFIDTKYSAALGNIAILAYFGKKIFLHPGGDISVAFDTEGVEYYSSADVDRMSFEQLIAPVIEKDTLKNSVFAVGKNNGVEIWRNLLADVNKTQS